MQRSKDKAKKILSVLPDIKNSFFFYTDLNKPTGTFAQSLEEFSRISKTIDICSIRFHLHRGDFEKWLRFLGDDKLSEDVKKLSWRDYGDEKLRTEITTLIEGRIKELQAQIK